jgi:2-keto-4-pentenoate hydratase/2-oxohepta-3-ene-1,7-dioic acid hydratase in catechol pathway
MDAFGSSNPFFRPSKILCVGRNYGAHARELGNEVPEHPLFFFKPPSALLADRESIQLPPQSERVEFEGEIAFLVGQRARDIPEASCWDVLTHVLPFNDVTARDLQRTDGQWARAKGFDTFAPAGHPVAIAELRARGLDPAEGALEVQTRLNGELRQKGSMKEMAFSVPFLLAWISRVMTLEPGDLLVTGTPAGVGPLSPGDQVEVAIPGVGSVSNPVVARAE